RGAHNRNDDEPVWGGFGSGSKNKKDKKDKKKPIGVPEDYTIPRHSYTYRSAGGYDNMLPRTSGYDVMLNRSQRDRSLGGGRPTIVEQRPRYHDGDEFKPASLDPATIGELQATMAAAGLLTGDFRYGIWDAGSAAAYKDLLAEANAQGLTAEQALQLRASTFTSGGSGGSDGSGGGGGAGGRWEIGPDGEPVWVEEQYVPPPLEIRTTNQDDLRRVFRAAVIDTMGQGWSQEQINEVVDAYNWKEIQVQQDAYNQQVAIERAEFMGERTEGGEVISSAEIASPETFLEDQMREKDPVGFQTGQVVNEVLPDFWQMMEGWA